MASSTTNQACPYTIARDRIQDAITMLRLAGQNEANGHMGEILADLERIKGVCASRANEVVKPSPKASQPAPAPVPVAEKVEEKVAPAPAPEKKEEKAAPKKSGLDGYRALQTRCKELEVSARGTGDELRDRIAKREAELAQASAGKAPEVARVAANAPAAKEEPATAPKTVATLAQIMAMSPAEARAFAEKAGVKVAKNANRKQVANALGLTE